MGYFYWLCVKNPNHLHTEISLGYLKDTKFYLKSKASFIHISSIASFKPFLIAWLWEYCTFSVSSVVSLKSSSWPKYTQNGTISPQKIMFYYQTFFLFQYVLYLSVIVRENRAGPKDRGWPFTFIFSQYKSYPKRLTTMKFSEVDVRFSSRYHHIMILASQAV